MGVAGRAGSGAAPGPDAGQGALLTLPPYSPDPGSSPRQALNPVENVWAYLRANKLAITVFDDYDDIVGACCKAWNFLANDPKAIASITARAWAQVS